MASQYEMDKTKFFAYLDSACDYDEVEDHPLVAFFRKRKQPSSERSGLEKSPVLYYKGQASTISQLMEVPKAPVKTSANRSDLEYEPVGPSQHTVPENCSKSIGRFKKKDIQPDKNAPRSKVSMKKDVERTVHSKRRKKHNEEIKLQPEELQIFRGLKFFFLPNDDIAPARRMRIRKTIEQGASWVQIWDETVTHLIADNGISYSCVLKYLRIKELPSHLIFVNEVYSSECIRFGSLVDPVSSYLRVDGAPLNPIALITESEKSKDNELPYFPRKRNRDRFIEDNPEHKNLFNEQMREATTTAPFPTSGDEFGAIAESPKDDLDRAVDELQCVRHLPLDQDIGESNSDQEVPSPEEWKAQYEDSGMYKKSSDTSSKTPASNFTCMQKHDGRSKDRNPNARTIAILQEMHNHYENTKDTWRPIAYRKAISILRKQDHMIGTAKEAMALPNIGERLALKIEEIATTDRLRRLESAQSEPSDRILGMFSNIYGVGFSQASKWIAQGLTTVAEVKRLDLTPNQRAGLDHYDDFLTRIPRAEVQALGAIVSDITRRIDPGLEVHIMGSYRRQAEDCGDVDMIITKKDASLDYIRIQLLDKLVPRLFEIEFLKAGLAVTSIETGTKWHGACCLPGSSVWRRIDFLLVPYEEIGAAMIYFTGNDIFNRSIRLLASRKNMRLNQHGLWRDVMRGRFREKLTQGSLVEGENERKIFEILGVPWRPPEHRNC